MNGKQSAYSDYLNAAEGKSPAELAALQKEMLLPVIEEEKAAFIRAEYGRLQRIIGAAYNEGGELHFFHPLPENRRGGDDTVYGDPEELTLAELAMLPHLVHVVPRLGTESTIPLIQYYPEDKFRMQLLARLFDGISIGVPCAGSDVKTLLNGHREYMSFKTGNEVVVIM
ncbi:MAG: hypothetical protein IJV40_02360 [Oscillospiraceae bacterium]|nr:hypothetical protein [Oscillospiraceae bacterium]